MSKGGAMISNRSDHDPMIHQEDGAGVFSRSELAVGPAGDDGDSEWCGAIVFYLEVRGARS